MRFHDRADAGRFLAGKLRDYRQHEDLIVLALPRGGVPVGYEVACSLGAPLEVFVVRKLGVPGHPELAMGAIAPGDICVLNPDVVSALGSDADEAIESVIADETEELKSREKRYRDDRPYPDMRDRIVILVDDGLATGATMRAAARAVRQQGPEKIVVAVPVAAETTCREFRDEVDEVICAVTDENFYAVGQFYEDFSQTTDEEVRELLARAARNQEGTK